jgi:glyoxylase-like metal-dependent hydrolase (beta-lactamase superfamily II)
VEAYSLWLVEYGACDTQPVSSVIYGKHNAGIMTLPFSYLVVKNGKRLIAVDTGYYDDAYGHELSVQFGVNRMRDIDKTLTDFGFKGEDFDTVILSHAHYDHMGGLRAFPNAHVYLQKKEWLDWLEVMALPKPFSGLTAALDPNDIKYAVNLAAKGKLTLVDGEVRNILPGISLYPVFDSHTYGSQLIAIEKTGGGSWIYTGDACYTLENFGEPNSAGPYSPVGFGVGSITGMVKALVRIQELAEGKTERLIICHDPSMWTVFPSKTSAAGFRIAEIQLAPGDSSRL